MNNEGVYGPQSCGVPGVVRFIYVPTSNPVVVKNLERGRKYFATYFDPVSGKREKFTKAEEGENGSRIFSAPPGINHDWLLILESK